MADVKLIENNARIGGDIATKLAELQRNHKQYANGINYYFPSHSTNHSTKPAQVSTNTSTSTIPSSPLPSSPLPSPSVLVIGSAALDITSQSPTQLVPGTTTPGSIILTPGGVGRNIAEAAQKLLAPSSVQLVSTIADDMVGRVTKLELEVVGLRTDGLLRITEDGRGSAACTLHLGPSGDLEAGVADMGIVEKMGVEDVSLKIDF